MVKHISDADRSTEPSVTMEDILACCREVGVRHGDTLFIHSDLRSIRTRSRNSTNSQLQIIVDGLKRAVGEGGTLIMPTFTYSFLNDRWSGPPEVYSVQGSPSRTGSLTEFFRRQSDVQRTSHPTHSVAVWGNQASRYLQPSTSTFNSDSVFGRLHSNGGTLMSIGVDMKYFTFIHYIERQFGVPYRRESKVSGIIEDEGKHESVEYEFYKQVKNICQHHQPFIEFLLEKSLVHSASIGDLEMRAVSADSFFVEGVQKLKENINYFSSPKPFHRIAKENLSDFFRWLR